MRRKAMLLIAVLAVGTMVGCAGGVPEWVDKGSGAFPREEVNAVYGVGAAAPDPRPQNQRDMASLNGRIEIARVMRTYVAELLKNYVRKHQDYFDEDAASNVQLYQQAARQVTEATLYGSRPVDSWYDEKGKRGPKGTLYTLMQLPLDNKFFDIAEDRYKKLLRDHQAKVLKKEAGEAFEELDKELEKARKSPFSEIGPIYGGQEEGEAEE